MRSVLSHLTSKFRCEADLPEGGETRLGKVVTRHRTALAAATQSKLSVQATDPPPEEVTEPLYDMSVYVSSPGEL